MNKLQKIIFSKLFLALILLQTSCAIVTINVYFPAEEVKDAFKSLEDELLGNTDEQEQENDTDADDIDPLDSMDSDPSAINFKTNPDISTTKVIATRNLLSLIPSAYAGDNLTKKILSRIKSDPAVQKAYDRRNGRLSSINKLLSKRLVGEGNKGLIVPRGSLSGSETKAVNDENADRKIIIEGMAKAIIEINKLDMTPNNIKSVMPQAAESFAAVRRDEVKAGSLIQLPDGKWRSK